MPFKSKAQRRWMYKNIPDIAKRWETETLSSGLPERATKKPRTFLPKQGKRK